MSLRTTRGDDRRSTLAPHDTPDTHNRSTRATDFQPASTRPSYQLLPLALDAWRPASPSPAEDPIESRVDLNKWLVECPAATFMVWIECDSMIDAGIQDGNVAIVDRSIDPQPG